MFVENRFGLIFFFCVLILGLFILDVQLWRYIKDIYLLDIKGNNREKKLNVSLMIYRFIVYNFRSIDEICFKL